MDAWLLVYFSVLIEMYTKFDFLLGRIDVGLRSPVVEHPLFPACFLDGRAAFGGLFPSGAGVWTLVATFCLAPTAGRFGGGVREWGFVAPRGGIQ